MFSASIFPVSTLRVSTLRMWALFACVVAAAGCATDPAPVEDRSLGGDLTPVRMPPKPSENVYRVLRGDTLYAIAFKRGLDYRDVAAWNGIAPPYRIFVDEELKLAPPPAGSHMIAVTPPPARNGAALATQPSPGMAPGAGATTAAAASASKSGSMFEDVPSQFSPPARGASDVPPVVASTTAKPAAEAPVEVVEAPPPERHTEVPKSASVEPSVAAAPVPPPVAAAAQAKPAVEPPPAPAPAKASTDTGAASNVNGIAWRWPSAGKMLGGYVGGDQTKQGIDIAGNEGDPVRAAADGEVVYSGNGLIGYGELIIVKHNPAFLSAYGHNRKRLVQEGDRVKAGQTIAEMGASGASRDELHFEIRRNGKPSNPLDFLPRR